MRRILIFALIPAAGCLGAFDDDGRRHRCEPAPPVEIDPGGEATLWVIDSVDLPNSASESSQMGMNLDGDDQGIPENALGQVLAAIFGALGSDLDGKVAEEIAQGRILHLLEVRATSLDEASGVGVRMFLGEDVDGDPSDNFSGTERFTIEPGHPVEPLSGWIMDGALFADRGVLPLRIAFPEVDEPFDLEITAARIQADVDGDRLVGRLGGAVNQDQIRDGLMPIVYASVEGSVEIDCDQGDCEPGSNGEIFLELFDDDADGQLSYEEVIESSLVSSLFAPDVDLFDEEGNYAPLCDREKESLSLGVSFTAVPAQLDSP